RGAIDNRRRRFGGDLLSRIFRDARSIDRVTADKLYIVGFMAAGKTTLARRLAKRLDWRSVDIDELIEQQERSTVSEIFSRRGEATCAHRVSLSSAGAALH